MSNKYSLQSFKHQDFNKVWLIPRNLLFDFQHGTSNSLQSPAFQLKKLAGVYYQLEILKDNENLCIFFIVFLEHGVEVKCQHTLHINDVLQYSHSTDVSESKNPLFMCPVSQELVAKNTDFFKIAVAGRIKMTFMSYNSVRRPICSDLLYENEESKDITLKVKENEIKVHSWILDKHSIGLIPEGTTDVRLDDYCFQSIQLAVQFFYEKNIWDILDSRDSDVATHLMKLAYTYSMKFLKDGVEIYLMQALRPSNVCKLANLSVDYEATNLKECCISQLAARLGDTVYFPNNELLYDEILKEVSRRQFQTSIQSTTVFEQ